MGQRERAVQDYDTAIALDPQDAPAYYNRGAANCDLGRREQALADFDSALRIRPGDRSIWLPAAGCW
jgi:tetratricopeptide (TPR) repeat protein